MRAGASGKLGAGVNLMAGLGVFGIAGYVFVAIIGYAFADRPAAVGALTSFYLLMNIIGPGLFAALEPETSRAVSARVATGRSIRPVVVRAATLAAWIFGGFTVVVLALWPVLLSSVLDDNLAMLAALVLGGAAAAAVYCVRGTLSGEQRFGGYALTLHLEGGARLLPCAALFLLAVSQPAYYAIAFAAGTAVAALALLPAVHPGPPGGEQTDPVDRMGRSVAFLATATLLTQLMANLAPVVVTYRMPDDLVAASAFGVTYVLARIPLVLFTPIQAMLLPQLSAAAAGGKLDVVRTRMRQTITVVLGLGAVVVVASAVAGPWAVRVLFNAATVPGRWTFTLLGASAVLIMVALVLQPALIALQHQRTVTYAWIGGTVVYVALLFAPIEPIAAALAAQLAGPAAVLAVTGGHLYRLLHAGVPAGGR
jgi:O-antigen/teichoic acid export membrane protein